MSPPKIHEFSDDSDDHDSFSVTSYTETNVLLGYASVEPIEEDTISHLGGSPTWLNSSSPLDARLAKCTNCNKLMSLLLQLDARLSPKESLHERMFYLWACREKMCRRKEGSVRVIRGVRVVGGLVEEKKEERKEEKGNRKEVGELLFGGVGLGSGNSWNPFGSGSGIGTGNNPFSPTITSSTDPLPKTFASVLNITDSPQYPTPEPLLYGPSEPWPSPLPHAYPHLYLDASYETLSPITTPSPHIPTVIDEPDTDLKPSSTITNDDTGNLDQTFQRFSTLVSQNPTQVLRYERHGIPLLYSDNCSDTVLRILRSPQKHIPACKNCGKKSDRVFEFQLMPHAISVLEDGSEDIGWDEGMEWGTIAVFACICVPKVRDGAGIGWVEDWVGVQWEAR